MKPKNAPGIPTHSAIANALADQGVGTMFGLIGDANLYMADSFVREHGGRFVAAAHEVGAVLMAIGHTAATGSVGVATVTHGPGLVNALPALIEAEKSMSSVVLLAGDTAASDIHNLQNIGQMPFVLATGAGFEQLRDPETVSQDIATAFRRAQVERRPIVLNIPIDFQWRNTVYSPVHLRISTSRSAPSEGPDLEDAVGIIAAARRPIVLAGRGAISPEAKNELIRLADRIEAPLATTLKGKGLFAGHPYDLGIFGTLSSPATVDAILSSDCVIAFGASLTQFTTSHGALLQNKRVVQVSARPEDIGHHMQPDACVAGDPALVVKTILYWLDEAEIPPSGFRKELTANEAQNNASEALPLSTADGTVHLHSALRAVDAVVPANRFLVTDAGRFIGEAWKEVSVPDPQSFLISNNYGSIGMGMAEAVGVCEAMTDRPVLLVTGDGGFMLGGLNEFNTAVRYGYDLIVVVCNDGSYGAEHVQFRNRGMDPSLSLFNWPDFAQVATALGGSGIAVRSDADFEMMRRAIKEREGPLLIDLKLDPDYVPPLAL